MTDFTGLLNKINELLKDSGARTFTEVAATPSGKTLHNAAVQAAYGSDFPPVLPTEDYKALLILLADQDVEVSTAYADWPEDQCKSTLAAISLQLHALRRAQEAAAAQASNAAVTQAIPTTTSPTEEEAKRNECPNCKQVNPLGKKYCGECGHTLQEPRCKCGFTPLAGKFCSNCGFATEGTHPRTFTPTPPPGQVSNVLDFLQLDEEDSDPLDTASMASVPVGYKKALSAHTQDDVKKISSNVFVPLANFRPYTALELQRMKNKHSRLTIVNSAVTASKKIDHKPISSEQDLYDCLTGLRCAEAILCPRMCAANAFAEVTLTRLIRYNGWAFAVRYIEAVRIKRQGTFKGLETIDQDLYQEEMMSSAADATFSPGNKVIRKRKTPEVTRPTAEEDRIKQQTYSKQYCFAFNKGECKQTGDHELVRKNKPPLNLKHLCVRCDSAHDPSRDC